MKALYAQTVLSYFEKYKRHERNKFNTVLCGWGMVSLKGDEVKSGILRRLSAQRRTEMSDCMFVMLHTMQGIYLHHTTSRVAANVNSAPSKITLFITNKCDEEQASRRTATLLLLHKHHAANCIYPSRQGTLPLCTHFSTILPHNAKSLKNKQGANKNNFSTKESPVSTVSKTNTDYHIHLISCCVRLSFMSSSYCSFQPSFF